MNLFVGLARLIDGILQFYLWIIFGAIILSWIPLAPHNLTALKIKHTLQLLTEPVFAYFRRVFRLHRYAVPVDLAPLAVILVIHLFRLVVVQTLYGASPISALFHVILSMADLLLLVYFWVVAIAAFFAIMTCFFAYHPWANISIPFLSKMTAPLFAFFRDRLKLNFYIHFSRFSNPLDLTPFLVLVFIAFIRFLLFALGATI